MKISKDKLEQMMAEKGMSTSQLAQKAGLQVQNVCALFRSKKNRPLSVGKVAKALECEISEIIESEQV